VGCFSRASITRDGANMDGLDHCYKRLRQPPSKPPRSSVEGRHGPGTPPANAEASVSRTCAWSSPSSSVHY
jgi:hypothetical protein